LTNRTHPRTSAKPLRRSLGKLKSPQTIRNRRSSIWETGQAPGRVMKYRNLLQVNTSISSKMDRRPGWGTSRTFSSTARGNSPPRGMVRTEAGYVESTSCWQRSYSYFPLPLTPWGDLSFTKSTVRRDVNPHGGPQSPAGCLPLRTKPSSPAPLKSRPDLRCSTLSPLATWRGPSAPSKAPSAIHDAGWSTESVLTGYRRASP